jgi:hypothetical protein
MGRIALLCLSVLLFCVGFADLCGFLDPRFSSLEHLLTLGVLVATVIYLIFSPSRKHQ